MTGQAKEYLDEVHGESKGYITKATIKNETYKQWHYFIKKLKMQEFNSENVYISLNTFYKPQRRIENIKELNALYIDLDIYNTNLNRTQEQILVWLQEEYFEDRQTGVPTPSIIVDSGRGLYLIWKIEPVPYKALPLWKAIEEHFYTRLKDFGADRKCLDPTRILRVPESINSKSKSVVNVIWDYKTNYSLRFIQEDYLPELTPKEKKKGRPKKIVSIYRERSLYIERIKDLLKLCELRDYDLRGEREYILFLYRYYSCYFTNDADEALSNIIELNNKFVYPLKRREVISATKSAETAYNKGKLYKYKNDTLIEILHITDEEQKQLSTIIGKQEYKRRDRLRAKQKYLSNRDEIKQKYLDKLKNEGKISKKEQLEILRKNIISLKKCNYKNSDISLKLDVPIKTIERHITYLKKQKLL